MPETPRAYIVRQYVFDARGERNEDVESFDALVTHHPRANRNARLVDGELQNVERPLRRSHGFIDGEFQEIEAARTDEYRSLNETQSLLVKDFILEDRPREHAAVTRLIDVPSPITGYVGRRDDRNGLVEIYDTEGGSVVARMRHLSGIAVDVGDTVVYGQSLGTQGNVGLDLPRGEGIHAHLEMDTRYFQQYENYIQDLTGGRLPVQATLRDGVEPLPVLDDNVARLGESSDRVRDVQTALAADGYRAADGGQIEPNGIYRPEIQGAVIAFQQDHGLLQTGDIDLATWQQATHINQRAQIGGAGIPQPEPEFLGNRIIEGLQAGPAEALAPGDPRFGLRPPSDPARTGREPQWNEHADHTQVRERGGENVREPLLRREPLQDAAPQLQPLPPRMPGPVERPGAPERNGPDQPHDQNGPPHRHGAMLLDNPSHDNHAMYATLLRTVNERDAQLGREPDEVSRQLAGGLTEQARARGLGTIGNASFTPDGTKVGMTDTKDLEAPWAKTAVGDVGQLAGQSLVRSSENVAAINQQQTLEQSLKPPTQTQSMTGLEDPAPKGPRMA